MKRILIVALACLPGLALQASQERPSCMEPLQTEEVDNAWAMGHSHDLGTLKKFFAPYIRLFPRPAMGAYVQAIEFRTPYDLAVLRSRNNLPNYSPIDARTDYAKEPNLVVVRIIIFQQLGNAISPSAEDYLSDFEFRVKQESVIEPNAVRRETICNSWITDGGCPSGDEYEVRLEFDTSQFKSRFVKVKVTPPDGEAVRARFDLDALQ